MGVVPKRMGWSDVAARRALARYDADVRRSARRLAPAAACGRAVDFEDLVAEGCLAVLEALSDYEGWGVSEETWVRTRVRQRMIDAIRRMDGRERSNEGPSEPGAVAEPTESARTQDSGVFRRRRLVSLDDPAVVQEIARLTDASAASQEDADAWRTLRERMGDALERMTEREREVFGLRLQGISLKEVGVRLSISESRACRLEQSAIERLRKLVRAA